MTTATIETTATGEAIRHHCPDCQGAIAAENVTLGNWQRTESGGQPCRQRKVTITCDHCSKSFATIERRFV